MVNPEARFLSLLTRQRAANSRGDFARRLHSCVLPYYLDSRREALAQHGPVTLRQSPPDSRLKLCPGISDAHTP
jgi:hypothetical protein